MRFLSEQLFFESFLGPNDSTFKKAKCLFSSPRQRTSFATDKLELCAKDGADDADKSSHNMPCKWNDTGHGSRIIPQGLIVAPTKTEFHSQTSSTTLSVGSTFSRPDSPAIGSADSLPLHHKLALATALLLRRRYRQQTMSSKTAGRTSLLARQLTVSGAATIGRLHEAYIVVCQDRQLTPLDTSEFNSVCSLLEARGLIRIQSNGGGGSSYGISSPARMNYVSLRLDDKGIERALDDNLLLSAILKINFSKDIF
ncbi:unnamed protein product [Protopolystoma xenopodis]|uniref:Cdc6 C-terminal domain-containing protein n=1 Tax=Protopolystoma xenopodis TaxID=117903 RepID=A0A3S5AY60_9PLAT|nr:unnamed protein product [Protopolystoma xenopodis]